MRNLLLILSLISLWAIEGPAAANDPGSYAGLYYGPVGAIGNGFGNAWVQLDEAGVPVALGMRLSENALSGLPDQDTALDLPLPVAALPTGFDHIGLNWNPKGHAPEQFYGVPHFDVHFYMMTPLELQQITMRGDDLKRIYVQPAAEEIPNGYIMPPDTGVPCMGCHWIDPKSPEFSGKPFTASVIYGFYNGHMNFLESMVTKAWLDGKEPWTAAVTQPQKYPKAGYYPTRSTIQYDPERREYQIVLDQLVKQ